MVASRAKFNWGAYSWKEKISIEQSNLSNYQAYEMSTKLYKNERGAESALDFQNM